MVITLLYKNTLAKIRKSFGRFLSLFMIIMVGVGFLAGIRESTPDIVTSLSQYMNGQNLMNFQIVSTMGLTDEDVSALKSLKNIGAVTPSYSLDVLSHGKAIRVQAIEKTINTVKVINGRMPKNDTECVADSKYYKPGDKISITSDVSGKLKNTVFTVAGTAQSALYLSNEYGNTTVGNGTLYSFIFVDRENFTLDAYTDIYITAARAKNVAAFSNEYENIASQLNDELVKQKTKRENARYQEIYSKADAAIQDSENILNDQKSKGEKELDDAKAQLDANASKLSSAEKELSQNEIDLQNQITAQNAKFQAAKAQIADGMNQINTALQSSGITREQLDGKISELNTAIQSMKAQQNGLSADSPEHAQLDAQIKEYSASYQNLIQLRESVQNLNSQEKQLNQGIATFNSRISDAENKITEGKNELNQNQKTLDDGYAQYSDNLAEFNTKISDAEEKIQDAKTTLSKIAHPKWNIFGRNDVINGYANLKSAMNTINLIAAILPLFFILIVALMTSNTMARIIAEERTELGTFTSLGFSDESITSTYLLYVLSATVLGAIGGFFLGCAIIPKIIYSCFAYVLPPLIVHFNLTALLLILTAAVLLMTTVTVVFCHYELKDKPAYLMRPIPPKNGKTILLERVGFIWNHLSFTWKITMRNIFRYKQRVFMTIVGIAGCTALLLTGFGIKDSINGVAQKQYQEVIKYQDLMVLKNDAQNISGSLNTLLTKENIQNPVLIRQTALTCASGGKVLDAYLVVPENEKIFYQYFKLKSTLNGAGAMLDDNGVIISQKIAENYKIGKGSKLTVKDVDGNAYTLTVSNVTENYIQNYIYMSKNLYSKIISASVSYNVIVSDSSGDKNALASALIGSGLIVNVSFTSDILQQAITQNNSLNSVVILLICVASLLAVIVLYNLTSINISERKREIATLKVLGFKDGETNEYIYRETFILTLISTGFGLICGIGFHYFVMKMIERDDVVYLNNIKGLSFLWAFLITMVFSVIMQIVTYFNLKKIDMIESLKSVE